MPKKMQDLEFVPSTFMSVFDVENSFLHAMVGILLCSMLQKALDLYMINKCIQIMCVARWYFCVYKYIHI